MGSFMKDSRTGEIFIPRTTIPITISPSIYDPDFKRTQNKVFSVLMSHWGYVGFKLELSPYNYRDQQSEQVFRRNFMTTNPVSNKVTSWKNLRTPYQQQGCYIDLNNTEVGSAYQKKFGKDAFADNSSYISIDRNGRVGLLIADTIHEFGHALGLGHEHQRVDRDEVVTIQNILQYTEAVKSNRQVGKYSGFVPFGDYDVASVMHYPGIFKFGNHPIGGTQKNQKFPEKPSYDDRMSVRFLYNEARIKEFLEHEKESLDSAVQPMNSKFFLLSESQGVTDERNRKLQINQKNVTRQKQRLKTLANTSEISIHATISRTHEAVADQLDHLKCLSLRLELLDDDLMNWSKKEIDKSRHEKEQCLLQQEQDRGARKGCRIS